MIYLLLSAVSAFFGLTSGLGPTTLLRPLLDAVSPLPPASIAMLCTMATLCAALVTAFFALSQPIPVHPDELILLAVGAVLGGLLGDLASARFMSMLPRSTAVLMQNALLFTLIALPAIYFNTLSRTLLPIGASRLLSFPVALGVGMLGSFLAFGAEPVALMLYFFLFDADNNESSAAALTITLFSMTGKLIALLIRHRMLLPDTGVLLWILPGALLGALLAMLPGFQRMISGKVGQILLRLSLFTSLLNMAAAMAG